MSFEGYFQKIGTCGHTWEDDASGYSYSSYRRTCPVCGAEEHMRALVDVTNGYGEEYGLDAVNAQTVETGFTDQWHVDHYGNKYATKHITYMPVGDRWVLCNSY